MKSLVKSIAIISLLYLIMPSCKKFVEIDPPSNSLVSSNVFTNTASAAAVVTNLYMKIQANDVRSFCTFAGVSMGLSSDELKNFNPSDGLLTKLYTNSLLSTVNNSPAFWGTLYNEMYSINAAIEGISASEIPDNNKKQLIGECKFLRAFFYFYLVNLYGNTPLLLTSDYQSNSIAKRADAEEVYSQIVSDLTEAKSLLTDAYLTPNNAVTLERVRPNKAAATALLARVYLFRKDYKNADLQASEVIGDSKYLLSPDLNNVFIKSSTEAIWQLQPSVKGNNTFDGLIYILNSEPGTSSHPVALSQSLINSFENDDQRATKWINYYESNGVKFYYPFKYKIGTTFVDVNEYHMVLRLAEQYLIRAEAKVNEGDLIAAKGDLDVIRVRAGLPKSTAATATALNKAIVQERRVELFTEWGHRWLDLKRLDIANEVMQKEAVIKGGVWSPNWLQYPIPNDDILKNANLIQNPGYN